MHGMSADISDICEFEFYDWVMFNDSSATFTETKFHVGRWLGPVIDVGSALTYKILKSNGHVVLRSTIRQLKLDEVTSSDHIALRNTFDDNIVQKIGAVATKSNFPADYLTPTFDCYDDDHQEGTPHALPEDEAPTPEIGDNHLNMEIMLPCGGTLARGQVIGRKRDHKGNTIGRANDNPILDSREYNVEFDNEDVSELTANVIAESMYAMCDENGDHILLFDSIIDHRKHDNAMTRIDQKFVDSKGKQQYKCSTKGWDICAQ